MTNLIGHVLLNRFRVDAFVASGGMGVVYRVWDTQRNVPLAMKVLNADLSEDPAAFKRFQREATALQNLAHPHIVPFYGIYQAEDATFLIEQYVDGPTLKNLMRQRRSVPMQPMEALVYLKALCSALSYAHNMGFVHCDVKPGNVMIDRGGNIYLTDFGIARQTSSTTTTLSVVGTPAYMAPEQIMGRAVTPATDIYALGSLLYELLTSRRPFSSAPSGADSSSDSTPGQTVYANLTQMPQNPRELNPSIPFELSTVILTAMAKDPSARYQSTMDLLDSACAAVGVSPKQIPTRVNLTTTELGTLRLSPSAQSPLETTPMSYQETPGTMRVSAPPEVNVLTYPEETAGEPIRASNLPSYLWILIIAGVLGLLLVCSILFGIFGWPYVRSLLASSTPTSNAPLIVTQIIQPTQGPGPSFTTQPTYTAYPTFTPQSFPTQPPPPPTQVPQPTEAPPPTQPPALTNIKVRIRNRTSYNVNLYRIGTSGESHFLGWLVPNYYGEYTFPGLGSWTIQYCRRDTAGNSSNCKQKSINVTDSGQEFTVP
jgi:serine/threonine protein kinase